MSHKGQNVKKLLNFCEQNGKKSVYGTNIWSNGTKNENYLSHKNRKKWAIFGKKRAFLAIFGPFLAIFGLFLAKKTIYGTNNFIFIKFYIKSFSIKRIKNENFLSHCPISHFFANFGR